jgi:hypothetical protein
VEKIGVPCMTNAQVKKNFWISTYLIMFWVVTSAIVYFGVVLGLLPMRFERIYLYIMMIGTLALGIGVLVTMFGVIFPVGATYAFKNIMSERQRRSFSEGLFEYFLIKDEL